MSETSEREIEKSVAQVYNNQPNNSVANDHQPEIQLTRFNSLTIDSSSLESHLKHQEAGPLSMKDLSNVNNYLQHNQSLDGTNKWPWSFASDNKKDSRNNFTSDIVPFSSSGLCKNYDNNITPGQEPFVVIWEKLSFKVNISLYDRIINRFESLTSKLSNKQDKLNSTGCSNNDNNFKTINSRAELNRSSSSNLASSLDGLRVANTKRTIFENLNGFIKSGEISAILGPSGSGKTSLLNALCGKVENYRGKVQLIGGGTRKLRLSMIPQKDYLIENLTVRENLLYSSKILNINKNFDHESNILNIVRMLNLTSCFESSVSNISGGEYKRVSIAQELLKQPDILILDEPTSGLDSLNCKNLIKSLAQLIEASRKGAINSIAIVMTIHQPDIDVFRMFDHVYCMAKKGRVIYDGHPNDVMEVLNSQLKGSISYQKAVDDSTKMAINPASLLIEIASENIYGIEVVEKLAKYQRKKFELEINEAKNNEIDNQVSSKERHEQLLAMLALEQQQQQQATTLVNSSSAKALTTSIVIDKFESINNLSANSSTLSSHSSLDKSNQLQKQDQEAHLVRDKRLNAKKDNQGQFWHHTNILAERAFKSTVRDSLMTITSLVFHLTIPIVMWIVYDQRIGSITACPIIQRELDMVSMISDKTMEKVRVLKEEMALSIECTVMLFLTTYSYSMCSIAVTALAFPMNMHILLKEVKNGWYSLPSFVFAKTIANFPFEVLFPVMSLMIVYILLGMPPAYLEWRFWAMALVVALLSIISHTHGLIFGALCMDSVETAIFLGISSTLPLTLLSGFTARIKNMPKLLQHISWLSPYRYSADALNIIRFGYGICPCDESTVEYLKTEQPNLSDIPQNMKPIFTYYLTNTANQQDSLTTTETITSTIGTMINATSSTLNTLINNSTSTELTSPTAMAPIGVTNDLTISRLDRNLMLSKIESNEIDLFKRLADLMTRSFTYGRELTTCDTIRSEVLMILGTPTDDYLPYLFFGMVSLIVVGKILLFILVKYKVGSRV